MQKDAQKLQRLEAQREALELRASQKEQIAQEQARISEAKKKVSPFSRALEKAKSFKTPAGVNRGLRGTAASNRTSRPSLFAENTLNTGRDEGYRGFDMSVKKKKGDAFSYRGLR
jgi:hypothetical protein